jgi:hypothetical protein
MSIPTANVSQKTLHIILELQALDELISICDDRSSMSNAYPEKVVWLGRKEAIQKHYDEKMEQVGQVL